MLMAELSKKVQQRTQQRTHTQRVELLQKARILDKSGCFSEGYFSEQTIVRDRQSAKVSAK